MSSKPSKSSHSSKTDSATSSSSKSGKSGSAAAAASSASKPGKSGSATAAASSASKPASQSEKLRTSPLNEVEIMKAICDITNQYVNSGHDFLPISNGKTYDEKIFGVKQRLFSLIKSQKQSGKVVVENVEHKFPIKSVIFNEKPTGRLEANTFFIQSEPVKFTKTVVVGTTTQKIVANVTQTAYYNLNTKKIKLVLSTSDEFHYVSMYKFDERTNTISLDPYTQESHKVIQPVKRYKTVLSKLNGPVVNIYLFINSHKLTSGKVSISSTLEELKAKMKLLNNERDEILRRAVKSISDKKTVNIFNFVNNVLTSEETRQEYDNKLKRWKRDYSRWTKKIDNIVPVEEHEYMIEFVPIGKEKLSNTIAKLLKRLSPYDSRIVMETTNEDINVREHMREPEKRTVEIMKSVNYGIYSPYLVSDILRYYGFDRNVADKGATVDLLAVSKDNIEQFCEFIHGFKSVLFSIISLHQTLCGIYSSTKCIAGSDHKENNRLVSFKYGPIYMGSNWVGESVVPPSINRTLIFNACKTTSNCLGFVVAVNPSETVIEVPNIVVNEPVYGKNEFSRIEDFDLLFLNEKKTTDLVASFSQMGSLLFGRTTLSSNYDEFYKNKFYEKEELEQEDEQQINSLDLLTSENFPLLSGSLKLVDETTDDSAAVAAEATEAEAGPKYSSIAALALSPEQIAQLEEQRKKEIKSRHEQIVEEERQKQEALVAKASRREDLSSGTFETTTTIESSNESGDEETYGRDKSSQARRLAKQHKVDVQRVKDDKEIEAKRAKTVEKLLPKVMAVFQDKRNYKKSPMDEDSVRLDIDYAIKKELFTSETTLEEMAKQIVSKEIMKARIKEEKEELKRKIVAQPKTSVDLDLAELAGLSPESPESGVHGKREGRSKDTSKGRNVNKGKNDYKRYEEKYLKYKTKYLQLKASLGL